MTILISTTQILIITFKGVIYQKLTTNSKNEMYQKGLINEIMMMKTRLKNIFFLREYLTTKNSQILVS